MGTNSRQTIAKYTRTIALKKRRLTVYTDVAALEAGDPFLEEPTDPDHQYLLWRPGGMILSFASWRSSLQGSS